MNYLVLIYAVDHVSQQFRFFWHDVSNIIL